MTSEAWVALLVGVPSVVVAVIALVIAARASKRSQQANILATQSNELAQDANNIATESVEHQKRTAPPAWGSVEPVSGKKNWFGIENRSGRDINVLEFSVRPQIALALFSSTRIPGHSLATETPFT